MNATGSRLFHRVALALWIGLAANIACAETASVIDPTEVLEAPKTPAATPKSAAQPDTALKRERARAEARARAIEARAAEARAAERESQRLRAIEQERQAEAAQEAAARAAAKKAAATRAAARAATARLTAEREAAIKEAAREEAARELAAREAQGREEAAKKSAAAQAAAREAAAREAAAKQAAARQAAAREEAARELAAREAQAREEAAREVAMKQAAARQAEAREAAERMAAAKEANFRDNRIKLVAARESGAGDGSMLKRLPGTGPAGAAFRDCAGCPELIWLPQGEFVMGDPATNGPRPVVAIRYSLAVGRFEVTFAQWDACVAADGCRRRPNDAGWGRGWQPVINVSWADAQQYVAWLSRSTGKRYRLLTEAEWEYAARAGTDVRFWWGDQTGRGDANCAECGSKWDGRQAAPVGRFAPNPFGLHDMHGNVSEWVEDCYHERLRDVPKDGRAWTNGCMASVDTRIVRGGAWHGSARSMRSTSRSSAAMDHFDNGIGFRVARTD